MSNLARYQIQKINEQIKALQVESEEVESKKEE